jgi:hypothetical protein
MLEVSGIWQVFALGLIGGSAAELVRWYKIRDSPNKPDYLKSAFYWMVTVMMILLGGGLAVVYGTENVNALLGINIGASAPLILTALASTIPPGTTPPPPGVTPQPKTFISEEQPKKKRRRELTLDFLSGR